MSKRTTKNKIQLYHLFTIQSTSVCQRQQTEGFLSIANISPRVDTTTHNLYVVRLLHGSGRGVGTPAEVTVKVVCNH